MHWQSVPLLYSTKKKNNLQTKPLEKNAKSMQIWKLFPPLSPFYANQCINHIICIMHISDNRDNNEIPLFISFINKFTEICQKILYLFSTNKIVV